MEDKQIISFLALNGYDIATIADFMEDPSITADDKVTFVNILAKMTEYSTQRAYKKARESK